MICPIVCRNPLFIKSRFLSEPDDIPRKILSSRNPLFIKSRFLSHKIEVEAEKIRIVSSRNPLFIKSRFLS